MKNIYKIAFLSILFLAIGFIFSKPIHRVFASPTPNLTQASGGSFGTSGPVSSVTSYTVPTTGMYRIDGFLNVTGFTSGQVQEHLMYTDENGNTKFQLLYPAGATNSVISSVGDFPMQSITIPAQAGSTITINTLMMSSVLTYDVGGAITSLQ